MHAEEEKLPCEACEARTAYEKLTAQELESLGITLGAYRSFRGNRRKHISYVSMPITSGKRLYDKLFAAKVKTADEFTGKFGKEAFFAEIMKPNIDEGIKFADELGARCNLLYIAPSVFQAKPWKWSQEAYMSLWYRVMGELAGSHTLIDGWEYSTGGVQEVLFSLLMQWGLINPREKSQKFEEVFGLKDFLPGITDEEAEKEYKAMQKMRLYDAQSNEIRLDTALEKVCEAVWDLHAKGFDDFSAKGPCVTLAHLAMQIKEIPELRKRKNEEMGVRKSARNMPYDPFTKTYKQAGMSVNTFGMMIQGR